MSRLAGLAILGCLFFGPNAFSAQEQQWDVNCPPTRPLAANECRITPMHVEGEGDFAILFSYMDRDLNFLISGGQRFTHGEVRIDGKHIFMTQLCGKGYCVFSGHLAEELAQLFRKGRQAEIELVTRKRNVTLSQRIDLSGFEVAFNNFQRKSR